MVRVTVKVGLWFGINQFQILRFNYVYSEVVHLYWYEQLVVHQPLALY